MRTSVCRKHRIRHAIAGALDDPIGGGKDRDPTAHRAEIAHCEIGATVPIVGERATCVVLRVGSGIVVNVVGDPTIKTHDAIDGKREPEVRLGGRVRPSRRISQQGADQTGDRGQRPERTDPNIVLFRRLRGIRSRSRSWVWRLGEDYGVVGSNLTYGSSIVIPPWVQFAGRRHSAILTAETIG